MYTVTTYLCSLTTIRSCVGSMVRSAMGKGRRADFNGIGGLSRSGSSADGRGISRTEFGWKVKSVCESAPEDHLQAGATERLLDPL